MTPKISKEAYEAIEIYLRDHAKYIEYEDICDFVIISRHLLKYLKELVK